MLPTLNELDAVSNELVCCRTVSDMHEGNVPCFSQHLVTPETELCGAAAMVQDYRVVGHSFVRRVGCRYLEIMHYCILIHLYLDMIGCC